MNTGNMNAGNMSAREMAQDIRHPAIGGALGLLMGILLVHPLSMALEPPSTSWAFPGLAEAFWPGLAGAFGPEHIAMSLLFGAMGVALGSVLAHSRTALLRERASARASIRALEGLIPICSYCKSVRDDTGVPHGEGSWHQIEHYISKSTGAEFTHGICPDCFDKVMEEEFDNQTP